MKLHATLPGDGLATNVLFCLVSVGVIVAAAGAESLPDVAIAKPDEPAAVVAKPDEVPAPPLSVGAAVQWALEHNPDLRTIRRQHGIAEAGVVIAHTYPFNPASQTWILGDGGPKDAGVTNHVFVEQVLRLDLEVRGQGRHRRDAASAALTRTEWEIATQEIALAIRVIRACNALSYRQEKLRLFDEAGALRQQTADQLSKLVREGKYTQVDLLLAQADLAEMTTLRGPAQTQYVTAQYDLRRLLGMVDEPLAGVSATLEALPPKQGEADLVAAALERRPEIKALQLAVQEADARLKLEIANRFGNPSFGPAYEYNETRVHFFGLAAYYPIPILNTHRGEIQQREAEHEKALSALQAADVVVHQDVQAALARRANAEKVIEAFRKENLPALKQAQESIDRLLELAAPGADVLRAIDIRRRFFQAQDRYLDALFELSQASADVAAATGDPSLAYTAASASN